MSIDTKEGVEIDFKHSTKEQRRSSKELRKNTKTINSGDSNIYFMASNENTSSGSIPLSDCNNSNQDSINSHGNTDTLINDVLPQTEGLKIANNKGNENIDLNENRKNSNDVCELLTQGDENLNISNKHKDNFNADLVSGKVVDTTTKEQNSDSDNGGNSYSFSFESSDNTKKENSGNNEGCVDRGEGLSYEPKVSVKDSDKECNVKSQEVDSRSYLDLTETGDKNQDLTSSHQKEQTQENKGQLESSTADTYTESFCSDSKTKSSNEDTKTGSTKPKDEDATLTETSWPSYCRDKEELPITSKDHSDLQKSDSKTDNNLNQENNNIVSGNVQQDSVKDHTNINLVVREGNNSRKGDKKLIQDRECDSDATISDKSFPTYQSEAALQENNSKDTEKQSSQGVTKNSSEVSSSAKTTDDNLFKQELKNNSEKPLPGIQTQLTDTQSNAYKESQKLRKKEREKTGLISNSNVSNPDDTLEDIEPITNIVVPLQFEPTSNEKTEESKTLKEDQMAKESFSRPAVKNPDSDVETEKMEDDDTGTRANKNEPPIIVTNGDDGVFSGDSGESDSEKVKNEDKKEDETYYEYSEDQLKEHLETEEKHDSDTADETDEKKDKNIKIDEDVIQKQDENAKTDENKTVEETEENVDEVQIESVEQIRRNIEIDHAVETVSELEVKVHDLMGNMKELMSEYKIRLDSQPLSGFVLDLDKFKGDFVSLRDAYKKYESLFVFLNKCLKDLRTKGDEVNNLISKRFREEDLTTWMESQEHFEEEKLKLRDERIAVERSALAKASEARSSVARAAVAVAETNQLANEAEIEAAEAESSAKKAWEAAELALKATEEARKAAIEKKKAEDEAKKRAQERAQKKAEEEQKKREEENKILVEEAKKKGTTFQEERTRADQEKAQREAARINPDNWPRYIYSVDPGDYDPGVGCIVRSIAGSLSREDIEVTRLDQNTGLLELVETEELVSNIIEIKPVDPEKKFVFEAPMSIAFPHCTPRGIPGKEPVIKHLQSNGKWAELASADISFEDIKELRFIETRLRKFGVFAVVLRLKRDTLTFTKKGNKVFSTSDARVSFTCKPSMFKMNTNFNIEVQPVELSAVSDIKQRHQHECGDLLAASPIVKFSILNRKFTKPLLLTMPLPPNTSKPKRPHTAMAGNRNSGGEGQEGRPLTARPSTAFQSSNQSDEPEEEIHLLVRSNIEQTWTILSNVKIFQAKNKDIVSFEINQPYDRFFVLRTKDGVSGIHAEKIAFMLETSIMYRTIQIFLRQKTDDPKEVIMSCAHSNRTERAVRRFEELGYEEGPNPSKDILVREGQILDLGFRGNIHCKDNSEKLKMIFNTHIKNKLEFVVEETEKFAQKSFHTYRGFVQVYSDIENKKLHQSDHQTPGVPKKPPHVEIFKERLLLTELLVNIPKPDPQPPKPLNTAPVKIHVEAPDTKDVLEFVANELGDEWKNLAQILNLKSVRIQAILRQNNANPNPKQIRYDMLISWAKRLPRSANKLEMLATALTSCGRSDIANELRSKDIQYRQKMAKANKDAHLKRAFIKVAQNPNAVRSWMAIARRLGVSEDEIRSIDQSKPSIQEKCFQSLRTWQSGAGDQASVHTLTDRLRKCRYRQLAREIEIIG